jgi:hypothetical protein
VALWRIIRDVGFMWRKSENSKEGLIEKDGIRAAILAYLRNVSRYRSEGSLTIYTDGTCIHSSHTKARAWSDGTNAGLIAPVSKDNESSSYMLAAKMASLFFVHF